MYGRKKNRKKDNNEISFVFIERHKKNSFSVSAKLTPRQFFGEDIVDLQAVHFETLMTSTAKYKPFKLEPLDEPSWNIQFQEKQQEKSIPSSLNGNKENEVNEVDKWLLDNLAKNPKFDLGMVLYSALISFSYSYVSFSVRLSVFCSLFLSSLFSTFSSIHKLFKTVCFNLFPHLFRIRGDSSSNHA